LALTVQQQAEGGATEKEQWREIIEDLWDNQLPHLQGVYGPFVYDPRTARYGFQEDSEYDSEESLLDDIINEPETENHTLEGDLENSFIVLAEDQQPPLESSKTEKHTPKVESFLLISKPEKEGERTWQNESKLGHGKKIHCFSGKTSLL